MLTDLTKEQMIVRIIQHDRTSNIHLEPGDWAFDVLADVQLPRFRGAVLRHQPRSVARNRLGLPTWVMDANGGLHALHNTFGKSAEHLVLEVAQQLVA